MKQYLDLVDYILSNGRKKGDRTGTGTIAIFGHQMRFNLQEGFPCLTTKQLHLKSIIRELLWFLQGDTNIAYLNKYGVRIWDEWADEDGELGPVYGKQWRDWIYPSWPDKHDTVTIESLDQIADTVKLLKENPDSRRILVSAWNPPDIPSMALPPCHCLFQFFSRELDEDELYLHNGISREGVYPTPDTHPDLFPIKRALSCQLYQRSCDVGLGMPFNIASYALLTMMFAQVTDMIAEEFIWTGGDTHIYLNHVDALKEQLTREPKELPKMTIKNRGQDMFSFEYEDFKLLNYDPHPRISMAISV